MKDLKKIKKGFTLLEVIVAIVVLAILTTMALPRYYSLVRKVSNQEAETILLSLYLEQMKYAKENSAFCTDVAQLDVEIPVPKKFQAVPGGAALHGTTACGGTTVAYLASMTSVDGNYTLYVLADGSVACSPCPSTICQSMGYDGTFAGKTIPCASNADCTTGSSCVVNPGVCVN